MKIYSKTLVLRLSFTAVQSANSFTTLHVKLFQSARQESYWCVMNGSAHKSSCLYLRVVLPDPFQRYPSV